MNEKRLLLRMMFAGAASAAIGGARAAPSPSGERSASLDGATGWLNTPALSMTALRGRVVLINFWTYSCINWRRQLPHVRAWAAKYKAQGLVVIGVHSPEFAFEKDSDNVMRAVKSIGVDYPVAIDSKLAIWRAWGNAYWPALYFIDAEGRLRHSHFGEGDYDTSERTLQKLLTEAKALAVPNDLVAPDASGAEAQADWASLDSPETYVGFGRARNLVSGGAALGKPRVYDAPARLRRNQWGLAGDWTLQEEAAILNSAKGRIAFNFHARDLHLVMGPPAGTGALPFRVSLEGKPPGPAHGVDVDEQGRGTLSEHRMYQLIRQAKPIGDRRFDIEFEGAGAEVFSFTFG